MGARYTLGARYLYIKRNVEKSLGCALYIVARYLQENTVLLLLLTTIEFSIGGSSPYTSTDKTNENKYTSIKQYKNAVHTIHNTTNTV
jgi:hypothetical protein